MPACQRLALLFVAALLPCSTIAKAEHCRCAHCGHHCDCQKVCRLVCEEKKVEVVCWGCKCEDFCLGGPSKPGCEHCEDVCETCGDKSDAKGVYAAPVPFVWKDWIPGCGGHMYTKKKLMKKTVTKKIPSFKWVVEDLCAHCDANCPCDQIPAGAVLPPPPPLEAGVKLKPVPSGPPGTPAK